MGIDEDGPTQPLPQRRPHCPELRGRPPARLELAAARRAVTLAFPLQVFSYHLEHQRRGGVKGRAAKGRSTEAQRRGGNGEHREGEIEARMTMEYQKRKVTAGLANSSTPSASGRRTEARAEGFAHL